MTDDGALEDAVCRSAHAAALALHTVERLLADKGADQSLEKQDVELLWFAANEARDHAEAAKARFYDKA